MACVRKKNLNAILISAVVVIHLKNLILSFIFILRMVTNLCYIELRYLFSKICLSMVVDKKEVFEIFVKSFEKCLCQSLQRKSRPPASSFIEKDFATDALLWVLRIFSGQLFLQNASSRPLRSCCSSEELS